MRRFWVLYRKEFRFVAGPGIGLIVLVFATGLFMQFIFYLYPGFYHDNIQIRSHYPIPIVRFIIRPIMYLGSTQSLIFIFAVLFFYSVLYEHFTRSRYQLFSLPVQRQTHLTAKFAAVVTWVVVNAFVMLLISKLFQFLYHILDLPSTPGRMSFELIVIALGSLITETTLMCTLVMIGYAVAVCLRRAPFLIGSATMFAGYMFVERQCMTIHQFFTRQFPWQIDVPALHQVLPWFDVVFPVAFAAIIVLPVLFIYEKFSEI